MDDRTRRSRRRWLSLLLRLVAVVATAAVVATTGGSHSASVPATDLQLVSFQDPDPPTAVVATSADRSLRLSWTAPTDNIILNYRVFVNGVFAATTGSGTTYTLTTTGSGPLVNGVSYVITMSTTACNVVACLSTSVGTRTSAPTAGVPRDAVPPAAPTGVAAVRGDTQVSLTWAANTEYDVNGYRVLRNGSVVSGVLTGRSYTDTGLVNDTTYSYTVQTRDTSGNWSASSVAVPATPTDLAPPATPTGLTATRGDGRVQLSWTANTEPDLGSYRVLRDGVEVATVPAGTRTYTDTGLVNDRTYRYTLVAVDTHGNRSAASSPAVAATPTDLTPPAVPTGFTATRGDGRVVLGWTANTETDLASYRVLRDGVEIATVPVGTTAYTDTAVVNDVTYRYALVAVDTHSNRSAATATTGATPTDLTSPAVPTGLTATPGDGRVVLGWTANTETDLASYRVLRDGVEIATVPAGSTAYTDTTVTNDVTYRYTLVAVDTHGNRSAATAPVAATPTDPGPPATPTGLTAAPGDRRVVLSWTARPETDLASFRLLRDGVEIATVPAATRTHTDTGLVNGTSYRYTVVAVDSAGSRSAESTAVTAVPRDSVAPEAPKSVAAFPAERRVGLTWEPSPDADLASYRVFANGVEVATVPAGTRAYTVTGLTDGVDYTFWLVAVDTSGNRSANSSTATGKPENKEPPAVPTGLAADPGDRRVVLTWTPNTEPDLASYRVLRNGTEIATVPAGTTAYTATGLTNGTTYTFALAAVDTAGNRSATSPAVSATPATATPPAAPRGLTAIPGDERVVLSWTPGTEPDLASYRLLRDGVEVATVPAGTTTYTDTGLVNDQRYRYTLVAVDTQGNRSAASTPAVSATPTDLTAPAVPVGLTTARQDGQVVLTWTPNTEADLASYRVLRDGVEIATVPAGTTTYTDSAVVNDTTYGYTLVAVDTHGNRSAASAPQDATPTDLTAPAAPGDVVATAGERSVTVGWTANTEPDIASYRVLDADGRVLAEVPAPATQVTATGLEPGPVTVTVVAVDTHGNVSPVSVAVTVTPVDTTAPAVPTGVTATAGDRSAVLRWTAVTDPDVAGYVVYRDGVEVARVSGTSATLTGLANGTSYSLTVASVDAGGNVSAVSVAVTVAPAPTNVPATGSGESGGIAVSRDGRFVVVGTRAPLEASDTNTAYELYRVDRTAGTATRLAPLGATASTTTDPTNTAAPAMSDDGRYVTLATTAALVATDTNRLADVYRLDTTTGTWALVSVPAGGTVSPSVAGAVLQTGSSVYATSPPVAVSADGDLVVFYSARADLVAGDANGVVDLFAKRVSTGAVTRVSTTATGTDLPRTATGPALTLTPDGRFVLFPATSSTGPVVLYRKTLSGAGAGEIVVVSSVVAAGRTSEVGVYRDAGDVAISDDGRYVAFVSTAKIGTTTPTANWSTGLAYRKDVTTGAVLAMGTGQTTVWEHQVALDPTGRWGFYSTAAAAVTGDTNGHTDVLRRDLGLGDGAVPGALTLVTADAAGRTTAGPSGPVAPSEYGRTFALSGDQVVLATSQALLATDTNRVRDLYLKDLGTGAVGSPLG